jgi:hypothetical protein
MRFENLSAGAAEASGERKASVVCKMEYEYKEDGGKAGRSGGGGIGGLSGKAENGKDGGGRDDAMTGSAFQKC